MSDQIHKLIIIGSGPAGLTAAIYTARSGLAPVVIAGIPHGGQLMQTTEVENYPGFPEGIQGPDLIAAMIKQAERFGTTLLYEHVQQVDFTQQPLKIVTDAGTHSAETVIIASGADANWLNLENEQRLRGKGVSACATCDGFFFRGKDVVVIGGGDSAMEEAIFLTKFASSVTVLNRSNALKASKIMADRAQSNQKIKFLMNTTVIDVLGSETVTGVKIHNSETNTDTELPCQGYFVAIGHTPASKVFAAAGVTTDQKQYIIPKEFTLTNIPGVFVAGDVHDHRYRQAISAAGEGCKAAIDVERYLSEREGREPAQW